MAAALSTYNVGGLPPLRGRAGKAVRRTTSMSVRGCLTLDDFTIEFYFNFVKT